MYQKLSLTKIVALNFSTLYLFAISMILWIDPWIRRLWYALITPDNSIVDAGVIVNEKKNSESYNTYLINDYKITDPKKSDRRMRFTRMYDTFHQLLKTIEPYQDEITTLGIEQFYFMARTQQHAEFLYGLRWALVMHGIDQERSMYDIWPTEMKKYITWRGWANKIHIHRMVMALYGLQEQPKYADISDALALAYVTRAMSKTQNT